MGIGIPNFLSLDAVGGYNFGKNFFMGAGLEFGTRLRKRQENRGQSWWLGAKSEFILPEGMAISLKVGRSF